jgi:hypothetical protein
VAQAVPPAMRPGSAQVDRFTIGPQVEAKA